jgi:hypothetical protein
MDMSMKHYSLEDWTDYVRGVADQESRTAMAAHLEVGCTRCARAAATLERVSAILADESKYQVPEYAVRIARAIFSSQRPQIMSLPRLAAKLIYDSIREPLPVGIRSRDQLTRRALYQAGEYFLDLRLEHEPGSPVLNMVGQLANRDMPARSSSGVMVLLTAGKDVVARTLTNRFGEFQMEYEPSPNLRLFVPLDQAGGRIELPLSRMSAEASREPRSGKTLNGKGKRPARSR